MLAIVYVVAVAPAIALQDPPLFVESSHWTVGVGARRILRVRWALRGLLRRPRQVDIEVAGEAGSIDDRLPHDVR